MRDLFIKDWGWKLFSLFLAVTIWLTVHRILEPEENLLNERSSTFTYGNLPVRLVSSMGDVSLYHVAPTVVKVTVSGPVNVMDQLQASQVRAEVDLTGMTVARGWRGPINVLVPPEVTLLKVEPSAVTIIPSLSTQK